MAPLATFPPLLYENEKKYGLYFCILAFSLTLSNQLHYPMVKSFSSRHGGINSTQPGETKFTYTSFVKWREDLHETLSCLLSLIVRLQNGKVPLNSYRTPFVLDHSFVMKSWYIIAQPQSLRTRKADWKCWQFLIICFANLTLCRCFLGSLDITILHATKFCTIVLRYELHWWINKH